MSWFGRKKDPPTPPPPYWVTRIRRRVLRMILAAARSEHPNEFGGVLRAEKGTITELVIVPGTVSGNTHAIFQLHMLPIDLSMKGTVHSHPTPDARPSDADRELFARFGTTHIIVGAPYTETSWRGYNAHGEPIQIEIVDA